MVRHQQWQCVEDRVTSLYDLYLYAYHHNGIRVELVIGYPRKPDNRLKIGQWLVGAGRTSTGLPWVTNHKLDPYSIVVIRI